MSRVGVSLAGRRVLITGAARGIGAATALRLQQRGALVALAGLEPDLLERVANDCGGAPWVLCDVSDRHAVDSAVGLAAQTLGGLDVVVANAGVAAQLPLIGGDPAVFEKTLAVNTLGAYYTLRAAGPHISHPQGYALAISSLAAAVQLPLLGAYSASKAAVEAIATTLRLELRATGSRVGIAYFAEIDTDMTSRGFGTEAASRLMRHSGPLARVAPLEQAVEAIERGIARRARRVVAPGWVGAVLPARALAQRIVDRVATRDLATTLEIARREEVQLTTPQPRP